MSKLLFISNITYKITSFAIASIDASQSLNIDFYHASNWSKTDDAQIENEEEKHNIRINSISTAREPFSASNITAYKQLVDIIEKEKIDYIHCNTPVGGILGRLAGRKCKVKKVIYQAHGFHFYKGAPKKNWLLYYPVEKLLARYTDAIITINQEDYSLAKNKLKPRNNGKVYYVPGVGIEVSQYQTDKSIRTQKREELGIPQNAFVLVSVGELNNNKNNKVVVEALGKLNNKNIHYVLCGVGAQEQALRTQAENLRVKENVHFLGYRSDIKEIYGMSDCFVMPSYREGLSRSVMEAMASGLPCVVSDIRGNVDLIVDGSGGYTCNPDNSTAWAEKIDLLSKNDEIRANMTRFNSEAIKKFSVETVTEEVKKIYSELFN